MTDRAFDTLNAYVDRINICTTEGEIYTITNGIDFGTWSSAMVAVLADAVQAKIANFKTPVPLPHKYRETVINRAISQNHYITDGEVSRSHTLRDVAVDYIETYRGTNTFVQDLALRYSDGGSLSIGQMRGALNVMVREARIATSEAIHERAMENVAVDQSDYEPRGYDQPKSPFYVNLADAQPVLETQSTDRVVPNGTYTVPINDIGEYRVIKLTDCPEHYNKPAGSQIAAFQSDTDNESAFTGFAFVNGIHAQIWKRFQVPSNLLNALDKLLTTGRHAEYGKIWAMASKRCFICGRKLTVLISKQAGIGPICAENVGIDINALAALNIDPIGPFDPRQDAFARARAQADIDELFES